MGFRVIGNRVSKASRPYRISTSRDENIFFPLSGTHQIGTWHPSEEPSESRHLIKDNCGSQHSVKDENLYSKWESNLLEVHIWKREPIFYFHIREPMKPELHIRKASDKNTNWISTSEIHKTSFIYTSKVHF